MRDSHSLKKKMLKIIEKLFDDYIEKVAKTYGHSVNDLKQLMNDNTPSINITPQPQPQFIAATGGGTCSFVLLRGVRAGTICGAKNKKNSEFCCQHAKKNVVEKEIVVIETDNKAPPPKKPNPVLRMNKIIGKWWHPDSGLVFKSSDEKIVIGIFKNNQLVDLSEEDVQSCVANKFKYVYNKRKREEEEQEENVIIVEHKKQKIIDEEFIKVNKDAKNVEILIKEMFNNPLTKEDEEEDDIEEEEDPIPDWLNDGAEETKENYPVVEENIDDAPADEEEEDFGDLSEEEDCMDGYDS